MAQVTFILAVVGFALAAGVAGFLWRRGFFGTGITTTPRVQMPWLMISGDVNTTRACGDKAFDGEVDVLLLYGFPPPPLAEVKVEIEIRDRKDVTVSLDQTDLGTFRNDMWKTVRFSGERTKPCDGGKFVVAGTAVSTGPGATTIADADVVRVDALDQVVEMPIHVSTSNASTSIWTSSSIVAAGAIGIASFSPMPLASTR